MWVKTSRLVRLLLPQFVWKVPQREKVVYLTFDDGPIPEVTEWVLNELKKYGFTATFFCIGDNVEKNPHIFQKIIEDGHRIGNHTFNHLNGWKTPASLYLENVRKCAETITREVPSAPVKLFRPPYGKITLRQAFRVRKMGYKIIMWDIISFDFDRELSPEKCADNMLENLEPGSIIVFHDSQKAATNMKYALQNTLQYLGENGYCSQGLD